MARTAETLKALMSRRLEDVRLAVLMLDGIVLKDHTNVVALGITTEGVKVPLGLWEGSTENKAVATSLLSDLVDRGLDVEQGVLVVIDGSKALRAAVNAVLGPRTPRSIGVSGTRSATCSIICPSATGQRSSAGCAARGRVTITAKPSQNSRRSPRNSSALTPVAPHR